MTNETVIGIHGHFVRLSEIAAIGAIRLTEFGIGYDIMLCGGQTITFDCPADMWETDGSEVRRWLIEKFIGFHEKPA